MAPPKAPFSTNGVMLVRQYTLEIDEDLGTPCYFRLGTTVLLAPASVSLFVGGSFSFGGCIIVSVYLPILGSFEVEAKFTGVWAP